MTGRLKPVHKHPQSDEPGQKGRLKAEPKVGIFWLVGNRLVLASTPLSKAEPVLGFRHFINGHKDVWAKLQRRGRVPREMEYEESPRGRVLYSGRSVQFEILADRCIASDKRCTAIVIERLGLPGDTSVVTFSHYRCANCMATESTRKQEKEDRES